ncbi:MAG: phosphoribosylformylglycinamidine synthase [Clostridia bacterium]|nr:phosphoribosylformylglycinamidine synthase [Clostridia bacterium]
MVLRVYVEKKSGFDHEARSLLTEARDFLGVKGLKSLRIINRYDVEGITKELFDECVSRVFSEPALDDTYEHMPDANAAVVFACEYLPGQYDQRADSAAQSVELIARCARPAVKTAQVFMLYGDISNADVEAVKRHVINPVEKREASLERVDTLNIPYDAPRAVPVVDGLIESDDEAMGSFIDKYALAMDVNDIKFCRDYFRGEGRNPTLAELRVIDTYWSDHCRHTTFLTRIDDVVIEDERVKKAYDRYIAVREELGRGDRAVTLMDMATIGAKALKEAGKLNDLDESDEINACTIKFEATIDGEKQDWLILFKNETHNHPTEIEPFGGAATCIGGAIRDPLSGRAYVYQAMRVTGAGDPTRPMSETLPGKLPQRQIVTTAAAGYSSYGNQIGLATGLVDEVYHPGYIAKRMEIGAVIGAARASSVRREVPAPGDVIVLLGGRTGRDGCGGATGSSKSHTLKSLERCSAEVQKGNAPEERKLQRLFRNAEASRLIKRCNDFGAGGVSVAIGEIADGLMIDLDRVPCKYEGLDGIELAISESQERMAVALDASDVGRFLELAHMENLEATVVANVVENPRMTMKWRGDVIVDISREFLNSNGAERRARALVKPMGDYDRPNAESMRKALEDVAKDLNTCSKRGLSERFDSTNGASSLLMPFGGRRQLTPAQAMASLLPVGAADCDSCTIMSYGFNPFVSSANPYKGAYLACVDSVAKLVATGAGRDNIHFTFQEYFERMTGEREKWGVPLAALLGAFDAQMDLGIASIGGKDSMSGSFEDIHVPPTLVSFAVGLCKPGDIVSNEFKCPGSRVGVITPELDANGIPVPKSLLELFDYVTNGLKNGDIVSAWAIGAGGAIEGIFKMALGNRIGVSIDIGVSLDELTRLNYGGFVVEYKADGPNSIATTIRDYSIGGVALGPIEDAYENRLEGVYPAKVSNEYAKPESFISLKRGSRHAGALIARPRVLIPVFPGTNCEYDTERAFEIAGARCSTFVVNNLTPDDVSQSVLSFSRRLDESQILFIPGGFSGGDEPDGSAKFIMAFMSNPLIKDKIQALLDRDGLIGGICNGFQALIKLGLVPYGEFRTQTSQSPTLTYNDIGRHQSRLVRTRVCSKLSPWLMYADVGEVYTAPVSHGEGRFTASGVTIAALAANGQIATQYVDEAGNPTMDVIDNPNGSIMAIEGITSPDGRVFGKMAHSERVGKRLYRNVPGNYDMGMFRAAVDYYE